MNSGHACKRIAQDLYNVLFIDLSVNKHRDSIDKIIMYSFFNVSIFICLLFSTFYLNSS